MRGSVALLMERWWLHDASRAVLGTKAGEIHCSFEHSALGLGTKNGALHMLK